MCVCQSVLLLWLVHTVTYSTNTYTCGIRYVHTDSVVREKAVFGFYVAILLLHFWLNRCRSMPSAVCIAFARSFVLSGCSHGVNIERFDDFVCVCIAAAVQYGWFDAIRLGLNTVQWISNLRRKNSKQSFFHSFRQKEGHAKMGKGLRAPQNEWNKKKQTFA